MRKRLRDIIAPRHGELAASDKAFNLICLRQDLHEYWGKAHFGLKWIGNVSEPDQNGYKTFEVQWHWMPSRLVDRLSSRASDGSNTPGLIDEVKGNVPDMRREVDLDTEKGRNAISQALVRVFEEPNLDSRQPPPKSIAGPKVIVRDEDGHLIQSGRVFRLKVRAQDVEKTETLIKAQWLALKIAAIAGAGENADDLNWKIPPPRKYHLGPTLETVLNEG